MAGTEAKEEYSHYVVDGIAYDLRDWIPKHPGGPEWFLRSVGRDISVAVHAFHKDPAKVLAILKNYRMKVQPERLIDPTMNVPPFIVPPDFDARKDVLVYDWSKPFLPALHKKVNTPAMRKKIADADALFDFVSILIVASHFLLSFLGVYYKVLPWWGFAVIFAITRTAMAAIGHCNCHRKKEIVSVWGNAFFDMEYVAQALILTDGHVMAHHVYTSSRADPKRTVFNAVTDTPRLYRLPAFTARRFANFLFGTFVRLLHIFFMDQRAEHRPLMRYSFFVPILLVRLVMIAEFLWAVHCEQAFMFFAQFFLTHWWNMFMIVSSHDFENGLLSTTDMNEKDWGVFQINTSTDTKVSGFPYVDAFLTAGLGCHRSHHVLPWQKSAFANIVSEPAVKEVCKEFGVEWKPVVSLLWDRMPLLVKHYLFCECTNPDLNKGFLWEHFSPKALLLPLKDIALSAAGLDI